ncbi:AAA domain-containing protein [Haliscomenobacter sp.]|uniref:AAA domain-containing protein n=1 Tax=Haliscomenobacter sp. TaxID=2717303 RepID=UPI003BAB4900
MFDEVKLPESLVGWVEGSNGVIVKKSEKKTTVAFESDPARVKIAIQFKLEFEKYYSVNEIPIKINKVYDALHTLHYELRGKENKKLYISFGLVNGKIGDQNYRNFLFHAPLRMTLKNHEIKIEFDTFTTKVFCEQNFIGLLDLHFANEPSLVREGRKKEILLAIDKFNTVPHEFVFDKELIRTDYYDTGLEILKGFAQKEYSFFREENLIYDFQKAPLNDQITFSFSPIIQTKVIQNQIITSNDAGNIITKINELQANEELHLIPDFFKKLFSLEPGELPGTIHINGNNGHKSFENVEKRSHPRFLFPLPYNDEQLEIARRLYEQDAVTVKGPPGTGKSHTIANLISHFVAEGKSILVVSHNAKALSVLKEKLPEEIKDLAVSFVNEGKGKESLKASVNAIIANLAQRYEEEKVDELLNDLFQSEKKYADTLQRIYEVIQANAKPLKVYNPYSGALENRTAYEWSLFRFEQLENYFLEIIKDDIDFDKNTDGLSSKLAELSLIGKELDPEDFDLVDYLFLDDDMFLDVNELRKLEIKLQNLTAQINPEDYDQVRAEYIDEKLKHEIAIFKEKLTQFKNSPITSILYEHSAFNLPMLKNILTQFADLRAQIKHADDQLLSYQLDLSVLEGFEPEILHQQINQLIVKFGNTAHLGSIAKAFLDKNLKRFFDCKVNFIPANNLDQFKLIEIEITKRKNLKQLSITFNNYLKTFGLPQQTNILSALSELDFLDHFSGFITSFNQFLKDRNLPIIKVSDSDLQDKVVYLENLHYYAEYYAISAFLKEVRNRITKHATPYPIAFKIASNIENLDRASYEMNLEAYRLKREKQKRSAEFHSLFREISLTLPKTSNFIKIACQDSDFTVIDPNAVERDLFFIKIDNFLASITEHTKHSSKLFGDLHTIKQTIQRQTTKLIAYKTWYHKSKKVSDLQKTALSAWLNDLIKIGQGTGINAQRDRASAIANMQVAKGAVPVWIMQQDTAITFFPDATPAQFDILIIDEASQCDISSLNLIFRCKKALIVGDENQTSVVPNPNFFQIDRINELLDRHLISHPHKVQFDIKNSIYTLSGIIYPNIATLREHFRCLPEIIGFSNRYIYNNNIVSLKTATEKPYGEPTEIHYVEDNFLDEAKPLIVSKIIDQIENYIFAYQRQELKQLPTIGILTLDSSNTKHQKLLIKQIAQNELISFYADQLELLIGTSREFQGDERDIMFLTITASHSINEHDQKIKPPQAVAAEIFMRIFNVAASRAKEKSVLIHSIHPEAIAIMNPDCYRKKLIDYYVGKINPLPTGNNKKLCDQVDGNSGDFEKTVCIFLCDHNLGDYVYPQFEIGKYKIDFALIKNNKKLAIECDGVTFHSGIKKIQEDIARQLILERAGWRFFRIQSTDWFYKNEQVSRQLLNWVNENTSDG